MTTTIETFEEWRAFWKIDHLASAAEVGARFVVETVCGPLLVEKTGGAQSFRIVPEDPDDPWWFPRVESEPVVRLVRQGAAS